MLCLFNHKWHNATKTSRICLRCGRWEVKVRGKWKRASKREAE